MFFHENDALTQMDSEVHKDRKRNVVILLLLVRTAIAYNLAEDGDSWGLVRARIGTVGDWVRARIETVGDRSRTGESEDGHSWGLVRARMGTVGESEDGDSW